jgi:hypothetical protein
MFTNNTYSYMDESTIHPLLKCKLCMKPFNDPVTNKNGDRFCRACATQFLVQRSVVKIETIAHASDNNNQQLAALQTLTPVTERLVLDMLDSLLVRCKLCDETNIYRGQLEEHEKNACAQGSVLCTAADISCSWVGIREALNKHTATCRYEPLRPAFAEIFNEHAELRARIKKIETQFNELIN